MVNEKTTSTPPPHATQAQVTNVSESESSLKFKQRLSKLEKKVEAMPKRAWIEKDQKRTDEMNIRVIVHSIHSDDGNPTSANIKQALWQVDLISMGSLTRVSGHGKAEHELTTQSGRSERVLEKPNEPPLSEGHTSGSGKGRMEHQFELTANVPITPHDSPLPGGYTPGSDEGRLKLQELMTMCTKLSKQVLDLEKEKDAQAFESSDDDLDEEDASKQGRGSDKIKPILCNFTLCLWMLEAEEESTIAFELIKFIKSMLEEGGLLGILSYYCQYYFTTAGSRLILLLKFKENKLSRCSVCYCPVAKILHSAVNYTSAIGSSSYIGLIYASSASVSFSDLLLSSCTSDYVPLLSVTTKSASTALPKELEESKLLSFTDLLDAVSELLSSFSEHVFYFSCILLLKVVPSLEVVGALGQKLCHSEEHLILSWQIGGGPRRQETIGDTIAQTRSENVSKHSNDPLLARGNTLRSGEDRLKLEELMALCTTLQSRVLALETTKTTQAMCCYNTTITTAITDVEMTLAQALAELKSAKPKADKVVIQEPEQGTTTPTRQLAIKTTTARQTYNYS
ncbi:hypothetical protein Tco_0635795 [Tanacetum coccineum]